MQHKLWICRRSSAQTKQERGIYVKHFKHIPMADMEIVLVSSTAWSLSPCAFSFKNKFYPLQSLHLTFELIFILDTSAREEKSKLNSHGLGQIPGFGGCWAGQYLIYMKFYWSKIFSSFVRFVCAITMLVFFFAGYSRGFTRNASSWSLGHFCHSFRSDWLLC